MELNYKTLLVNDIQHGISVTLNRPEQKNALNSLSLSELQNVISEAEKNPACRVIILKGQQGLFCTGMDFHEAIEHIPQGKEAAQWSSHYMALLKRISLSSKIVIAQVDGQVMAGGIGLVAASDLVIATSKSQFSLSEALWALLPANVLPYLIRRVGFQKAYLMTLTTQTLSAAEAHTINLVDELTDQPEDVLKKLMLRFVRLEQQTVSDLKRYLRKLWIIDEKMEQTAIQELARLIQEPRVQGNIKRFVEQGKFPWEKK